MGDAAEAQHVRTPVRRELRNSAILLRLTLSRAIALFRCGEPLPIPLAILLAIYRGLEEPPAGGALVLVDRALVFGRGSGKRTGYRGEARR